MTTKRKSFLFTSLFGQKRSSKKGKSSIVLIRRFKRQLSACGDLSFHTVSSLVDIYESRYDKYSFFEGEFHTSKLFKNIFGICNRYSVNHSFSPLSFRRSDHDGFPELVKPFKHLLRCKNTRFQAMVILALFKLRSPLGKDINLDTITDGTIFDFSKMGSTDRYLEFILREILDKNVNIPIPGFCNSFSSYKRFLKKFSKTFYKKVDFLFPKGHIDRNLDKISDETDIHVTCRAGPNGPALLFSPIDFLSIRDTPLLWDIKYFLSKINCVHLMDLISSFESTVLVSNESNKDIIPSRLCFAAEPGGKLRIFAIVDYFTQSCFTGLHKFLFNRLKYQFGRFDGTFSHDFCADIAKSWTCNENLDIYFSMKYSVDLSAATDRIPRIIQQEILANLIGDDLARTWTRILCERDFSTPNGSVQYNTGQPMGALSSWAMLAIWHHVIIQSIFRFHRKPLIVNSVPQYLVIGDDVSFISKEIYETYVHLVHDLFGVEINPLKGYTPETALSRNFDSYNTVEIAKRIFSVGEEISTPSPVEFFNSILDYRQFPNLINSLTRRGSIEISPKTLVDLSLPIQRPAYGLILVTHPLSYVCPYKYGDRVMYNRKVEQLYNESGLKRLKRLSMLWTDDTFNLHTFMESFHKLVSKRISGNITKHLTNCEELKGESLSREILSKLSIKVESDGYSRLLRRVSMQSAKRLNDYLFHLTRNGKSLLSSIEFKSSKDCDGDLYRYSKQVKQDISSLTSCIKLSDLVGQSTRSNLEDEKCFNDLIFRVLKEIKQGSNTPTSVVDDESKIKEESPSYIAVDQYVYDDDAPQYGDFVLIEEIEDVGLVSIQLPREDRNQS